MFWHIIRALYMYVINSLRAVERRENVKFVKVCINYCEFGERIRHVVKREPG